MPSALLRLSQIRRPGPQLKVPGRKTFFGQPTGLVTPERAKESRIWRISVALRLATSLLFVRVTYLRTEPLTMKTTSSTTRRYSVQLVMATAAAVLLTGGRSVQTSQPPTGSPCGATINPIQCENQLAGAPASEWDVAGAGDPSIQGFTTEISVDKSPDAAANRTVFFKVDTTASAYAIDIYRLGYYSGMGARKVRRSSRRPHCRRTSRLPAPRASGLLDCGNWHSPRPGSCRRMRHRDLHREADTPRHRGASHIIFVVRDDARQSDVIVQTADTTWQAYNNYGGNSLYTGGQTAPGVNPAAYGSPRRAYKVSYNRPLTTRGASPQNAVFNAEYPMVRGSNRTGTT